MMRVPSALNVVLGPLLLLSVFVWSARGVPVNGLRQSELDSAVDGVQKYLESSGFPKMTRGEVMEFLNDFSRNSRVSRSDNTATGERRSIAAAGAEKSTTTTAATTMTEVTTNTTTTTVPDDKQTSRPKFPEGESPLNYGYPMSAMTASSSSTTAPTTAQTVYVTAPVEQRLPPPKKKTVGPSVDVTAYSKFKKIPEARNVKIDDEMAEFLGGFGLLDAQRGRKPAETTKPARRRHDDDNDAATGTTVDELLLRSLLVETGAANGTAVSPSSSSPPLLLDGGVRRSAAGRGHVFNPSDSDVKTVDVNRIAKIVENIRLLTDGNETASLSQDAIRKKLENITSDIATIDRPVSSSPVAAAAAQDFDGYQVFFDDDTKQVEPDDLPVTPNAAAAAALAEATLDGAPSPPDPLSTEELQQLVEKNKNDVKRQQPAAATDADARPAVTDEPAAASTSSEVVRAAQPSTDSSEAATATSATAAAASTAAVARDASTTEASPSLSQLAESFGGGETASSNPPTVFETEAPRNDRPRNGLYFYVDWNSFLTVNEGQKNQVNLRFSPKAGNPAHFLKVNVP